MKETTTREKAIEWALKGLKLPAIRVAQYVLLAILAHLSYLLWLMRILPASAWPGAKMLLRGLLGRAAHGNMGRERHPGAGQAPKWKCLVTSRVRW